MSEFPKSKEGLIERGYKEGGKSLCRGCGAEILWFKTPNGKNIPLDPGTFETHWSSCPKAGDFRKQK